MRLGRYFSIQGTYRGLLAAASNMVTFAGAGSAVVEVAIGLAVLLPAPPPAFFKNASICGFGGDGVSFLAN